MDRPDVFMPLYIGDYLAGTSRLTTEQHGAYLLLIMDYWMNGPLPDNDQVLASICKCSPDAWSMLRASLEHFFSIDQGQWKHKRIEQELEKATEKKRVAKEKAAKAAAARWEKREKPPEIPSSNAPSNAPSIAQAVHKECPSPSPSQVEPNGSTDISGDNPPKNQKADYPDWFESLWKRYPPRAGSNDKRKAFHAARARMKEGKTVDDLTGAVDRYYRFVSATGKLNTEFIKQAATFFGPGGHIDNEWRIPDATGQPSVGQPRENALRRIERQAREEFALASAEEAGNGDVGAHEPDFWPQVGESGG